MGAYCFLEAVSVFSEDVVFFENSCALRLFSKRFRDLKEIS